MSRSTIYSRGRAAAAASLLSLSLLSACDDAQGPLEPPAGPAPVAAVQLVSAAGDQPGVLTVGDTLRLVAVPRTAAGEVVTGRRTLWQSQNPAAATVDDHGLVTARGAGTATITATVDGRTARASFTVVGPPAEPPAVAEVRVAPTALVIEIGGSRAVGARGFDAKGGEIHGRAVAWSSSAPAVAVVDQSGVIRALAPGYAEIHATIDGRSGTATVTVPAPEPVQYVVVSPATGSVWVGGQTQLRATTLGGTGGELSGRTVGWHSEDPDVARVDSAGRVTGVAAGAARIAATSEGRTGFATIVVHAVPSGPVHSYHLDGVTGMRGAPQYLGSTDWTDAEGVTHRVARFIERGALTLRLDAGRYEQRVEIDLYTERPFRRVATITLVDQGTLYYDFSGAPAYYLRSDDPGLPILPAEATAAGELTVRQSLGSGPVLGWVWVLDPR